MTIHVVTPVFRPNREWLSRCIESVRNQTCGPVTHTLVVDGNPHFEVPVDFGGQIIRCPQNHNDYGDTPRSIGIQAAIAGGASVIALLDDDNWFEPDHIERAIYAHEVTDAALVASGRAMVDLDGRAIGVCSHCGTREFADTSAMVYFPQVFPLLGIWEKLDPWMHAIGDRVVWNTLIDAGFEPGLTNAPTLNYRCTHAIHYQQFGKAIPAGVKHSDGVEQALERWSRERHTDLSFTHQLTA
jgi:hypothetical protein